MKIEIGRRYCLDKDHLNSLSPFWRRITKECIKEGNGSLVAIKKAEVKGCWRLAPKEELKHLITVFVDERHLTKEEI